MENTKAKSIGRSGYLKNKGRMWKQSGQHSRKALLGQLRRYVAEHQESQHKWWWNPEVE